MRVSCTGLVAIQGPVMYRILHSNPLLDVGLTPALLPCLNSHIVFCGMGAHYSNLLLSDGYFLCVCVGVCFCTTT